MAGVPTARGVRPQASHHSSDDCVVPGAQVKPGPPRLPSHAAPGPLGDPTGSVGRRAQADRHPACWAMAVGSQGPLCCPCSLQACPHPAPSASCCDLTGPASSAQNSSAVPSCLDMSPRLRGPWPPPSAHPPHPLLRCLALSSPAGPPAVHAVAQAPCLACPLTPDAPSLFAAPLGRPSPTPSGAAPSRSAHPPFLSDTPRPSLLRWRVC